MKPLWVLALFLFSLNFLDFSCLYAQFRESEEVPCHKQQRNSECDEGWFTMGFGSDSNELIHGFLRANFGRDYPLQMGVANSRSLFGAHSTSTFNISKGISFVDEVGRFSIFGGPSLVIGDEIPTNLGLSANAQVNVSPRLPMGIGLDIYGTLSRDYKMIGLGFSFIIEGHK